MKNPTVTPVPVSFWTFSAGQGLAAAGETATLTALTIHLQGSGGTGWVTALTICSFLPSVVLASPTSRMFDRWSHASVLLWSILLRAVLTIAAAAVLAVPAVALAVYIVIRSVSVPEMPAVLATGSHLAPREWSTRTVYSRLAMSRNIGAVAGPAVAGLLLMPIGTQGILVLDTAACMVLLVCVAFVRRGLSVAASSGSDSLSAQRYRLRDLVFRSAAAPYIGVLALAIAFTAALPIAQSAYLNEELRLSPADYGLIIAAYAAGRLTAALVGSFTTWPRVSTSALVWATVGLGLSLFFATLIPLILTIMIAFIVAGYCNTLQVLSIRTVVHDASQESKLPQAFTALGAINNGATLLGTACGGAFIAATSGELALQVAGAATAVVGLVAACWGRTRASPRDPVAPR